LPTPLGHSLAGLAVHLAGGERSGRRRWLAAAALVALANMPDFDLLPGYLIGEPRAFHWGPAHSIAAALIAGICAGLVARALGARFLTFFALGAAAYASHLVLDLLLGPGAISDGLQLFWPVSTERFTAPFAVFLMMPASPNHTGPVGTLFSMAVLPLMARELAILAPVCLAAWLLRQRARIAARRLSREPHLERPDAAGPAPW
jgi:membrane-bound metal-dependent hydrolase YbcI (DUF457 family)